MKRRIALVLALALAIASFGSRASTQTTRSANFAYRYNLRSTTFTYCRVLGLNGSPWTGNAISGLGQIKTTGSSTAVTENTAGQAPFAPINVDDILVVKRGTTAPDDVRVVAVKTDNSNITVDTAVDWSAGFQFNWFRTVCGTTASDGWIETSGLSTKEVVWNLVQLGTATGGIDVQWQCKSQALGSTAQAVFPGATGTCTPGTNGTNAGITGNVCNFTAAGNTLLLAINRDLTCPQLRIGMAAHTAAGAQAVETDRQRITITLDSEKGS